jgi:osmotically-inducible protein OsmY
MQPTDIIEKHYTVVLLGTINFDQMEKNMNIMALVQEALAKDSNLKPFLGTIYIFDNQGVVTLKGSVPDDFVKGLSMKIVSAVAGVKQVIDELKVEPKEHPRVDVQIDWANGDMALGKE